MAIDHLLEALDRDADAEVREILGAAEDRAQAILDGASRELVSRRERAVAAFRDQRQQQAARAVAGAAARERETVLVARAEMLGRLRRAVHQRLPSLLGRAVLVDALATAALAAAGEGAQSVRCSPAIVDTVRDRAGAVAVIADPAVGSGLRVALAGDRGEVDATLETLFDRAWPALQILAVADVDGEVLS